MSKAIPIIKKVEPLQDMIINCTFANGKQKQYDVACLIPQFPIFNQLKDKELFSKVKVDVGGFGIIWNDNIGLSEYEIWSNGQ